MSKKALCFKRNDLIKIYPCLNIPKKTKKSKIEINDYRLIEKINKDIFKLETNLIDRSICEQDPYFLQVIPYILLKQEDKYFIYSRGPAGDENRLHYMSSMGLGGHVEDDPNKHEDLLDQLTIEACRELQEEVGLLVNKDNIKKSLLNGYILASNENDVSNVHIGIGIIVETKDFEIKPEFDIIIKGNWLSYENIKEYFHQEKIKLETWSEMMFSYLSFFHEEPKETLIERRFKV